MVGYCIMNFMFSVKILLSWLKVFVCHKNETNYYLMFIFCCVNINAVLI